MTDDENGDNKAVPPLNIPQSGTVETGQTQSPAAGKRALAIFNAGARTVTENVDSVLEILRGHGFEVAVPSITTRASAAQAIREHMDRVDLVIAAGGDGTLNSALIARGRTQYIDVGRVNGIYFFNEASIGLSVSLCRKLTSEAKARFGVFAILYQAIQIMRRMRRFRALVSADGKKEAALQAAQITIGNSQNFGGLVVSDDASIDDRLLDLYGIEFKHWWSYFEALLSLMRHRYDDASSIYTLHGKRFEIRTSRQLPIEADGEIVAQTPATFEIVPHSVNVFVPAPEVDSST
jgi:diacylglycerol kinase (ATP)